MAASIQFSRGVDEAVIPDVRLTRARDGNSGTAKFYFENPTALGETSTDEITGMYMVDDEGEITTKDVRAKFVNGKPEALEVTYTMKSAADWDRFIRFMDRYATANGLEFSKS